MLDVWRILEGIGDEFDLKAATSRTSGFNFQNHKTQRVAIRPEQVEAIILVFDEGVKTCFASFRCSRCQVDVLIDLCNLPLGLALQR